MSSSRPAREHDNGSQKYIHYLFHEKLFAGEASLNACENKKIIDNKGVFRITVRCIFLARLYINENFYTYGGRI